MPYCGLAYGTRIVWKHLVVRDGKIRREIVERRKADYPFRITDFANVTSFSFQVLGDTGEGDRSQDVIADDFAQMPNDFPDSQFGMILGDVVYPDGNASDYTKRFFVPYEDYPLPIYATTGNHDWYGELEGYQRHFMATSNIVKVFQRRPVNQPNVYFFIETQTLRIICLDSGKKGKKIDDVQLRWLRAVCELEPTDKRKILLLHHPLYSKGKRNKLARQLDPVINKYRIPLVIAAHVHDYEKYTISNDANGHTTVHVVNGGGGAGVSPTDGLANNPEFQPDDFYPSAQESKTKFKKVLGLFRAPAVFRNCRDEYPYYKSFLNVSVEPDQLEVTVFKKKGFRERPTKTTFVV